MSRRTTLGELSSSTVNSRQQQAAVQNNTNSRLSIGPSRVKNDFENTNTGPKFAMSKSRLSISQQQSTSVNRRASVSGALGLPTGTNSLASSKRDSLGNPPPAVLT